MGTNATKDVAFPSLRAKGQDYNYQAGCGGKGGSACAVVSPTTYIYWIVTPPKFAVRNRHLLLLNDGWSAYNDAGTDPNNANCPHSPGTTTYGYTVYLLYTLPASPSSTTFATNAVSSKVIAAPATPPFTLNFDSPNLLPQQKDPRWVGSITVVVDMYQSGLVTQVPTNYELFKTTAFDYDERI